MTNPTKSHYTITEAHRVTGKSRTTIQKHLKRGLLSSTLAPDGVTKLIAAIELVRAYGSDACKFRRAEEGTHAPPPTSDESATLRTRLEAVQELLDTLRDERRREREQLSAQVEHLQSALKLAQEGHNRATLLLESRSAPPRADQPPDTTAAVTGWRDKPWWRVVLP
jgi:hypothetical protein